MDTLKRLAILTIYPSPGISVRPFRQQLSAFSDNKIFKLNMPDSADHESKKERGLTQSELGEKVSLAGDRIRQYENDVRCPKPEMLQKIAEALNVNILAISDPSFNDAASAIYALFELEDTFNFHLNKNGDTFCLSFDQDYDSLESSGLKNALEDWHAVKNKLSPSLDEDIEEIQKKVLRYENWKWNYPKMSSDSSWERLQRIEQYKKQIELLENEEANNNSSEA